MELTERKFISRYVLVVETDRPSMKRAGKIHREYEAMATRRQAEAEMKHRKELNKNAKNKRYFIIDQDKQPDYPFEENVWANP